MNENNSQFEQQPYSPGEVYQYNASDYSGQLKKNKFLTVLFAIHPGVSQMYQGLMKKGISMMIIFYGIIAAAATLYLPIIAIAIPILWFYSFFDAINRINYTVDELKAVEDKFFMLDIDTNGSKTIKLFKNKHLFIGWGLLIVGIYVILNITIFSDYDLMNRIFGENATYYLREIKYMIPQMIIPIVCLVIGIKLIMGGKNKKSKSEIENTNIDESKNDI